MERTKQDSLQTSMITVMIHQSSTGRLKCMWYLGYKNIHMYSTYLVGCPMTLFLILKTALYRKSKLMYSCNSLQCINFKVFIFFISAFQTLSYLNLATLWKPHVYLGLQEKWKLFSMETEQTMRCVLGFWRTTQSKISNHLSVFHLKILTKCNYLLQRNTSPVDTGTFCCH